MRYLLKYKIGDIGLATPIEEIKEIVRPKTVDALERSTKYLLGYIQLRSEKILLYDLPGFLGVSLADRFEVIIADLENSSIGFKVTRVFGIITVDDLMPFPEIVKVKDYFQGVVKDNGSFLQVLSFKKLLSGSRLSAIRKSLPVQSTA